MEISLNYFVEKEQENFFKPVRAHYNDAGADVKSTVRIVIDPNETVKIPLGFGLNLPDGIMAAAYPRSGMTTKGIISHVPPIDSGYTGQVHAILTNTTEESYLVHVGDKVAQLVITPVLTPTFISLEDRMKQKERGDNGFGSTGF